MKNNVIRQRKEVIAQQSAEKVTIDLHYLSQSQAQQLIKMFDDPVSYAENFSAIKAITRGLFHLIHKGGHAGNLKTGRMFNVVNHMQDALAPDSYADMELMLHKSGLMPESNVYSTLRKEDDHVK